MNLRLLAAASAAIGLLATAGAANALVTFSVSDGAPDPGALGNETSVINFDPTLESGVLLSGDYNLLIGPIGGQAAPPAGDTTRYLSVPKDASSGTATMDISGFLGASRVANFSFYWGSIDTYNTLELLNRQGNVIASYVGLNVANPANGNQTIGETNRRVFFTLTGADQNLGGLRYTSTSYAFESDTYAFNAVPEPATWALMIMGFGSAGAMLRRRRTVAA